ncbi:hypothetical protein ACLOJK_024403 [Asimina triloba]
MLIPSTYGTVCMVVSYGGGPAWNLLWGFSLDSQSRDGCDCFKKAAGCWLLKLKECFSSTFVFMLLSGLNAPLEYRISPLLLLMVMRKTLPDLFDAQPDLLFQLVTMLNPSVLQEHGVPVYGALQSHTFIPKLERGGWARNSFPARCSFWKFPGLNCAEAVNFAPADWLPHGGFGAELYRLYHKAPVLSHEELLCVLAKEMINSNVLPYLKEEISRVFMKEKICREKLWTNGIVMSSLMSPRKQPEYVGTEEALKEMFLIEQHWEHLCECNPSKHCLLYRQTLAELSDLVHKVTPISVGPWSLEVATQSSVSNVVWHYPLVGGKVVLSVF